MTGTQTIPGCVSSQGLPVLYLSISFAGFRWLPPCTDQDLLQQSGLQTSFLCLPGLSSPSWHHDAPPVFLLPMLRCGNVYQEVSRVKNIDITFVYTWLGVSAFHCSVSENSCCLYFICVPLGRKVNPVYSPILTANSIFF